MPPDCNIPARPQLALMLQYITMNKKRSISPEDKALFRTAVKGIKPLTQDKHRPPSQSKTSNAVRKAAALRHDPTPGAWMANMDTNDWLSAKDTLHFARSGLQHKLTQRLQRGQMQLEACIDLHQQTTTEAMTAIMQFIDDCIEQGMRCVCIIHGKGHFSKEGQAVLKNFINQWLRTQHNVLAFHSAKPRHGGTGAIYVLLKGKRA